MVADFSYQLPALDENFAAANLTYHTVTNYTTLIEVAERNHMVTYAQRIPCTPGARTRLTGVNN